MTSQLDVKLRAQQWLTYPGELKRVLEIPFSTHFWLSALPYLNQQQPNQSLTLFRHMLMIAVMRNFAGQG